MTDWKLKDTFLNIKWSLRPLSACKSAARTTLSCSLIIVPSFPEDRRKRYVQELGRILRKDIHLVIMNRAGEMLLAQIFKSGKLLLQRHSGLYRFKAYSYVMIADFMIYRKIAEKGFLQKMKGDISD